MNTTNTLTARFNGGEDLTGQAARLHELASRRRLMISYCEMKIREEDWHGVADAAMDLRDIDAEVLGLNRAR